MAQNKFYTVFAKYYHKIFPVNEDTLATFTHFLKPGTLLDVGCGSGEYSAYFNEHGFRVSGFDLSRVMIENAKLRHPSVTFFEDNMLTYRRDNYYDNIICIGSTLAHLGSLTEIQAFIDLSLINLTKDGVLIIKTVDYSFITEKGKTALPSITSQDGSITLVRNYELTNGTLFFCTTLITPEGTFRESTPLLPLTFKTLKEVLQPYKHEILKAKSQLTIVINR